MASASTGSGSGDRNVNVGATGNDPEQKQSKDVTARLIEIFGDADQTSIRMQGSVFHSDEGKFSGVKDEETRERLREAGLLLE